MTAELAEAVKSLWNDQGFQRCFFLYSVVSSQPAEENTQTHSEHLATDDDEDVEHERNGPNFNCRFVLGIFFFLRLLFIVCCALESFIRASVLTNFGMGGIDWGIGLLGRFGAEFGYLVPRVGRSGLDSQRKRMY